MGAGEGVDTCGAGVLEAWGVEACGVDACVGVWAISAEINQSTIRTK